MTGLRLHECGSHSGGIHMNSEVLVFEGAALVSGFPHLARFREEAFLCIGDRITGCSSMNNEHQIRRLRLSSDV